MLRYHFNLITCVTSNCGGIGYKNSLPWTSLKEDMDFFKKKTMGNTVIMGKNTWNTLKAPLPNRNNIIVSNELFGKNKDTENLFFCKDFKSAHIKACSLKKENFVIGGSKLYGEALKSKYCKYLFINSVDVNLKCDTYFPKFEEFKLVKKDLKNNVIIKYNNENGEIIEDKVSLSFEKYENLKIKNRWTKGEENYLKLVKKVLDKGKERNDRTGEGTISLFAQRLKFDLSRLPLITTKYTNFDKVLSELLFFISGKTDSKILKEKYNNNIWDLNTTKEFLEKRGLNYREGDMGPSYGFQWRHTGAIYEGCDKDYTGEGVDQLQNLIDGLKKDPHSRRHLVVSYVPHYVKEMALPPCHCFFQFYVDNNNKLSCQMYQRSADLFLGVPFNIASYSVLTTLIAKICGYGLGKFTLVFGDVHIYKNHIEQCKELLKRSPQESPILIIENDSDNINDYKKENFKLKKYNHYPYIYAPMAV